MKVLLLGKTGLLGSEFPSIFEREEIDFSAPDHLELDLLDFSTVDALLAGEYFDRILYCAAYTNVDKAEKEQGACEMMNVKALENILSHKRPLIHFSSDYVFSGNSSDPIEEDALRAPLNFYGETKAKSEEVLESSHLDFWNIRTSGLFGSARENFISKILKASLEKDVLEIVDDQIMRPTYAKDLAEYVFRNFVLQSPEIGHYHAQSSGPPLSWAEFATYILDKKGWEGEVERIRTEDMAGKAKRPKNSILKNTKLPDKMRDWREAVDEFLESQ